MKCISSELDRHTSNLFSVKANGGSRGLDDVEGRCGSVGVNAVFAFKKVEVIGS